MIPPGGPNTLNLQCAANGKYSVVGSSQDAPLPTCQSEGFPRTRYFIPVCVVLGVDSSQNVCSVFAFWAFLFIWVIWG